MVKWLGEANIALPAGATTAITGLLVHTQAGVTSGTFDTTSNIQEDKANGICLDCSGPLTGEGCNPPTLQVTAQESPAFCSVATVVFFEFTVIATNTAVPLAPTLVPDSCTPEGFVPGTSVYQVKCPAGTTEVTLTMSQDLGNGCPPTPGSDTARRSITPVPVVTVTPPEGPAVCADAGSKILDFGVSSDQGGPIRIQSLTPGICTSNVQVVASGGTFQVNCPGPFTGSFPVTLTAESGDPDCEGSGTASSTVTVNTRPTLDVTRQSVDEEFCETRQEATYSFTVAAPDLAPGALIELAIPSNCEFTTPTGLTESSSTYTYPGSSFDVGIKCKKEGGWPRGFKPELTATAGKTDCTGDDSDSVNLTITPLPDVRVEIDEPIDDVCSNDQDGFTFTATVYNDNAESNAKLGVTAVWGVAGQAGTACTANPNAHFTSGTRVTISCDKPSGSFTAGAFSLRVDATAGVTDCTDSSIGTATLTVNPKPTISITGPLAGQVCEDDQKLSVTYNIVSSDDFNTDLTFNSLCTASPSNNVPAGLVVLECEREKEGEGFSPWPEPFNTQLSATAGEVDCRTTQSSNTEFTINKKLNHKVAAVKPTIVDCAKGNFTIIDFTVTDLGINSTARVSSVVTSQPAVAMSCAVMTVSGNTYKVKCESAGTLPAGFNVTLTVESGATGCTRTVSATSVVTLAGCCGGGGDTAFATIRPRPTDPVTNGNASCFGAAGQLWPDCSNRWGWRNEFSVAGTQEAVLIAGAADGCKNTNKVVGRMSVKCTDEGTTDSRVILGLPDNFGITPKDNHFYVGCKAWLSIQESKSVKKSPGCQPPSFLAPKDTVKINSNTGTCGTEKIGQTVTGRCGGQAAGIFQNPQLITTNAAAGMLVNGCQCKDVYWLVHQADGDWRYARDSNGQCTL